jgi:hypothetical protein
MTTPTVDALVVRADEVRDRLFGAIEALDRKRHALSAPVAAVEKLATAGHGLGPALIAGGVLAVVATGVGLTIRSRRGSARRDWWSAVALQAGTALVVVLVAEASRAAVSKLTTRRPRLT